MKFKSTLLLITTFCIVLGTQAQFYSSREFSYYYNIYQLDNLSYFSSSEKDLKLIYDNRAENDVKTRLNVIVNEKNDTLSSAYTTYNKKGRIIRHEGEDKKGRKTQIVLSYQSDTLLTRYELKYHKNHKVVTFKYNTDGNLTHLLHTKNGENHYEITKHYMGKHLLEFASIDYSKRNPKTYKMLKSIDKDGKVLRIDYYTNDNLERVWEYDCSDKGVEVKPKKSEDGISQSSSCSWKAESSDDSYTLYHRTLNGKHIRLYERHFSADSVLVQTKTYDEDDRLKYESRYYDNHKITVIYKPNGKIRSYYTEVLDPELGMVAKTSVYYGLFKSHSSVRKTHNEKGLLVESDRYSNNDQTKATMTYSYFEE